MSDVELMGSGDCLPRKRILAACEACRDNKIRCRPSEKPGVCRKCLAAKRECIVRAKPRVRRMTTEQDSLLEGIPQPPAGPSKSFSIDFKIPLKVEVEDNFESLRDAHADFFDTFLSSGTEPDLSQSNAAAHSIDSTATDIDSDSFPNLHTRPSFNLASAESLFTSFQSMLCHFPCIVLPPDASVSLLATTQPFLLLAILAATSGSRTLQGNSLYEEEFRKVLGLKFVAGGERTVEMLQAILIFCAWYPFHLRPRTKYAFRYIRIATEIIYDLGLDKETLASAHYPEALLTIQQLNSIRAYLGYFYLVTNLPAQWRGRGHAEPVFNNWTATCCSILERNCRADNDVVLASLVRLSNTASEALHTTHDDSGTSHQQSRLVLLGLETQLRDIESRIPPHIASIPAVYMQSRFAHLCLQGGALLKFPRLPLHLRKGRPSLPPIVSQLYASVDTTRTTLSYILSLDDASMIRFCAADWSRYVCIILLAIRSSLPVPECPEFDSSWARSRLRLHEILEKMCEDTTVTTTPKTVDILCAMRAIMAIVKDKYNQRLHILEHDKECATPRLGLGCPMLDGSMDAQLDLWQSAFDTGSASATAVTLEDAAGKSSGSGDAIFNDLWAATMAGWENEDAMSGW